MFSYSNDFIRDIPKTDLHVHLDGSLRLPTLIELAKERGIELPSYTSEGLRELVFKEKYDSLDEYLRGFSYTSAVLNDFESLQRAGYELALDCFAEGVRYVEVRFAPQLHMSDTMSFEEVMKAVDVGLRTAMDEINRKIPKDQPEFAYGIIICAMRFCNEHFSPYYNKLFTALQYSSLEEKIKLASLELIKATAALKDNSDIKIAGFDIAGSEYGYPADNHEESYDYAHEHFIHRTVHAGEAFGPESIFTAITACHADRIGHGLFLFDKSKIVNSDIVDKARYIKKLSNFIAEKRITIEVCLTSNLQTTPEISDISKHSFPLMLENNLSVTLCTDNRLVSNTTISDEIRLATSNFNISPEQLRNIVIYGFKRSFFYGSYTEKRRYVRKCIEYYDEVQKKHGIKNSQLL